ncbi:MAG: hypothetical protein EB015_19680, partial [Methylocystaceae bacterium]|nr:hypothetical protein [Methylocystaceae bacterium]
MAISDIFSILGLNSPAGPSYGAGDAATAATNPLAAVAAPSMSGYNDADVAQARSQTLMSLAPLLIGAGMRQMPSQRAATLAAGAAVLGQMPHNILNAAQTRLLNQREAQQQDALQREEKAAASAMSDPNVPSAIKNLIQADRSSGLKYLAQVMTPQPTDFERNVAAMTQGGLMSRQDAIDRLHPSSERYGVVANPMGDGFLQYSKTDPNDTKYIPAQSGTNTALETPPATPAPMPNPAGAFGPNTDNLQAGWSSLWGSPPSKTTQEHIQNKNIFAGLHNRLAGDLSGDLAGAGRSKFQVQQVQQMFPAIGSWFTGGAEARNKYQALLPMLDTRMNEAAQTAQNARTKSDRDTALASYTRLRDTRAQLENVIKGLSANEQGHAYTPGADAARGVTGDASGGASSGMST